MKRFMLAALTLCACGSPFTGEVSGYGLSVHESLVSVLTDWTGASTGAALVLSDQSDTCALLAAAKAPSNATLAFFEIGRTADNKALSPDTGDYTIGASGASVSSALGEFLHTDANGTDAIPSANAVATSGLLSVTALSTNNLTARFDGKFGAQDDAVTAEISANLCVISTDTLGRGFLGSGEGQNGTGGGGGGTKPFGVAGSCSIAVSGAGYTECSEYLGSSYTATTVQDACTSGTYASSSCPVGTGFCTMSGGTATKWRYSFSSNPEGYDPAATCSQQGGVFSST